MQYHGDLYGKVAGKYFPAGCTKSVVKKSEVIKKLSEEIDKIESKYDGLKRWEKIGAGYLYSEEKIEGLRLAIKIVNECY